jgi:aspartyl-tRNA(Asn)/glutamyl-tRNA(Gln) amidotransferase subunit B
MPEFEAVIGMEAHAELKTESKMFCGCKVAFGDPPNTHTCPVCLALPGALPVPNRRGVEFCVRLALALNCEITRQTFFSRKNYFYPDLPKGYQISQYEVPIGRNGWLEIPHNEGTKRIGIRRVHLEEDTGKLFHWSETTSQLDFNRAGVPLVEIVTEPDIRSAEEARAYVEELRRILVYLGVCDGKMEEGSLRCEPNLSLRPVGSSEFGVKTELKNIGSFRAVERGVNYEIERQRQLLLAGERVQHETRRWDEALQQTILMRVKETESEYRYFFEPDLMPMNLNEKFIAEQKAALPELPEARVQRFISDLNLPQYDARVLCAERPLADYYEAAVAAHGDPKKVSNWVMGEFLRLAKETEKSPPDVPVPPHEIAELLTLLDSGAMSQNQAKQVFAKMWETGQPAKAVAKSLGATQVSDISQIAEFVHAAFAAHPEEYQRLRNGEEKLIGYFTGEVMKLSRGKANPKLLGDTIRKLLS